MASFSRFISRRAVMLGATGAALSAPFACPARGWPRPCPISATRPAGGIGPETRWRRSSSSITSSKNVLKNCGEGLHARHDVCARHARSGCAVGGRSQADIATLSGPKRCASPHRQGRGAEWIDHHLGRTLPGWPSRRRHQQFHGLEGPPPSRPIAGDLKGKKIGVNAFASAVDLALREIRAEEKTASTRGAAGRDRGNRVPEHRMPAIREKAHRLRRARDSVPRRSKKAEGRPAAGLHWRRCVRRSFLGDFPGHDQRVPEGAS